MAGTKLNDLDMWTVKEAAYYYRVHKMLLYRLARIPAEEGGPPVQRIGEHIRFPREEFIAWAKKPKGMKCSA